MHAEFLVNELKRLVSPFSDMYSMKNLTSAALFGMIPPPS